MAGAVVVVEMSGTGAARVAAKHPRRTAQPRKLDILGEDIREISF